MKEELETQRSIDCKGEENEQCFRKTPTGLKMMNGMRRIPTVMMLETAFRIWAFKYNTCPFTFMGDYSDRCFGALRSCIIEMASNIDATF